MKNGEREKERDANGNKQIVFVVLSYATATKPIKNTLNRVGFSLFVFI